MTKFKLITVALASSLLMSTSAIAINEGGGGRIGGDLESGGGSRSDHVKMIHLWDSSYEGDNEEEPSTFTSIDSFDGAVDLQGDEDPKMHRSTGPESGVGSLGVAGDTSGLGPGAAKYSIRGNTSQPGLGNTRAGMRDK